MLKPSMLTYCPRFLVLSVHVSVSRPSFAKHSPDGFGISTKTILPFFAAISVTSSRDYVDTASSVRQDQSIPQNQALPGINLNSMFSNTQHFAVYTCTIGSCMPSRRLRRLDAPLVQQVQLLASNPGLPRSFFRSRGKNRQHIFARDVCHCRRHAMQKPR